MSERPWNIVTMGDGSLARLQPWGSIERIRNADGSLHCNHSGDTPCSRSDHETIATYIVEPIDAWPESPADPEEGR